MTTARTVSQVNKAIAKAGITGLELIRGEGYFYFIGPNISHAMTTSSVYCCYLNQQTVEAWVGDAQRCADEIKKEME